jgi:hypothetical protein
MQFNTEDQYFDLLERDEDVTDESKDTELSQDYTADLKKLMLATTPKKDYTTGYNALGASINRSKTNSHGANIN